MYMKKTILALWLLAASAIPALAHTISVGYAWHQEGSYSGLETQGKTSCDAALLLGNDMLGRYAGNEIRSVRVSLPATKVYVDSVVVWVRQSLDGENLASGKITRFKNDGQGNITAGWNDVALSKPVAIAAGSDYYVGYTYYQRTKVCATRLLGQKHDGVSFVRLGSDAAWTETADGTLAIEAGVDGSLMPDYDVWLMSTRGLVLADGTRQVEARMYNRGQQPVSDITFSLSGSGYDASSVQQVAVQPDQLDTLIFNLDNAEALDPGASLDVEASRVNGEADGYMADNRTTCLLNYLRIVLVEEFTTEQCPNCPRAAEALHDILEGGNTLARNIAAVCHHSGYHTDAFTTQTDIDYMWFYNDNGDTFAPAMMFDRRAFRETGVGPTPVNSVGDKTSIENYVRSIADNESALVLQANAQMAADGKSVDVEVKGCKLRDFGTGDKRVTVFLTEDNVLANGQAGSGSSVYYHQHVMRGINATWGAPVVWNGDEFSYTCSLPVDAAWKQADLKVVASVGDYDSSDPGNCRIENSAVAIPVGTTAISAVADGGAAKTVVAYYSADGTRIDTPRRGLCIVKYSDGTTQKRVLK